MCIRDSVWTDENGYYSTAASYIPHSYHTNQEEAGAGIWFGQADVDDTKGALPYGTYYIEEVRCEEMCIRDRNYTVQIDSKRNS